MIGLLRKTFDPFLPFEEVSIFVLMPVVARFMESFIALLEPLNSLGFTVLAEDSLYAYKGVSGPLASQGVALCISHRLAAAFLPGCVAL